MNRLGIHLPMTSPVMIGRTLPAERLIAMFEQASAGHGQIALISGEAGIGKSRLLREVRAQLANAQVLQVGCYELDQMQPYAPFIELLRQGIRLPADALSSHLTRELETFLSGLAPGEAQPERWQLAQFITRIFTQVTQTSPLVIIIEDVHWCDEASLDYLAYLAHHLHDQPILLILTWRSDSLTPALIRCLAAVERTRLAAEFPLTALSRADLAALVSVIFGQERPLRADFLEHLGHLTEGNPFFVEEVLQALAAGEARPQAHTWNSQSLDQLQIPRTVQASVQQRVQTLTPAARQILNLGAVIGRRFDFFILRHLTGQDEDELLSYLRELIAAQLIVEESPDSFVFRHALTRQAVYTALLARERRALHRRIAQGIEQAFPEGHQETFVTDLAYHYYQGELWVQAAAYAAEAGQRAQRLHSPAVAVEHYTHALLATRHTGTTLPLTLLQSRGKMYEMLGEFEAARGDFEQVLKVAEALADMQAEAQGLLDLGFLWTARDYDKARDYYQQAASLARGAADVSLLAMTLNRIGLWQTHSEHPFEALQHHSEALSLYRQLEDKAGIGETLDLLGVTAFMAGDIHAGWHYLEEAIALCRAAGNRPQLATLLQASSIRGGALLINTLVCLPEAQVECVAQCQEAIQIAREIRAPATEAYARILFAHTLGWQGLFERALNEAQTALQLAEDIEHRMWQINAHVVIALLHLEILDFSTALAHLEQAQQSTSGMGSLYIVYLVTSALSRVYIAQEKLDQAEQILQQIIRPNLPTETLAQRLLWAAQAELRLVQGRPDEALDIVDRLIATTRNQDETTVIPSLWFLRGQALAGLRQTAEAESILHDACVAALNSNNHALTWRSTTALGQVYLGQKKRAEAQESFDTARRLIDQLAGQISAGEIRDRFYQQAASHLPRSLLLSPQKAARRQFEGLTTREREVAALVAQGKTNRAIAEALTLSERTIEKHIENIMNKLGFNARSQIAVWAAEKKLEG